MNNEFKQRITNNEQRIQSLALKVGFDACGISKAEFLKEDSEFLNQWLSNGNHGEMGYMERNIEKRVDPRTLVPNAKSVISVILNYFPGNPDISTTPPKVSRYALSKDYHEVIKEKLTELLELIRLEYGNVDGRTFVDSAPVLDKAWAVRAGLGWIGKNSLLINKKLGSYTFIGELIIDLEIKTTTSVVPNHCGTCTRCIDSCPTGAIISPGIIDSRKCISYLTIEKKSDLTTEEFKMLNGWCFGCDICQEVCPWNSKVKISECKDLLPKQEILNLKSNDLISLSKAEFERIFHDTPLNRSGFERFNSIVQSFLIKS
ncbi:MAG: tRNA epoxyqueuosine(34) reductase QueG [Tenuifilaceae bacterium]